MMNTHFTSRLIALCILIFCAGQALAQNPYTLIDRQQLPRSVAPVLLNTGSNQLFFIADTPGLGRELWVDDSSGAHLVRDIFPGPQGAFGGLAVNEKPWSVGIDQYIYFIADDGEHGEELWRSDGTEAGTIMLGDLTPGPASTRLRFMHRYNDKVFFIVENSVGQLEFWRTYDGTSPLTLLRSTNSVLRTNSEIFAAWLGGELYFVFDAAVGGLEIWKTNLSVAGTLPILSYTFARTIHGLISFNDVLVLDGSGYNVNDRYLYAMYPPSTSIGSITNFIVRPNGPGIVKGNSTSFFSAYNNTQGSEIWRTNGYWWQTAIVADLTPGPAGTTITQIIPWGDRAIVRGSQGPQGEIGPFVWLTNSSGVGATQLVVPFANRIGEISPLSSTHFLMVVAGEGLGEELWISDGTPTGTSLLVSIAEGTASSYPSQFSTVGEKVYFTAYNSEGVQQLWFVSAVTRAASKVADLSTPAPVRRYIGDYYGDGIRKINDSLVIPPSYTGHDLFTSRGTPGTTQPIPGLIFEKFLSEVNDRLLFIANPQYSFNGQISSFEGEIWGTTGPAQTFERYGQLDYGTFVGLPQPISAHLDSKMLYRARGQVEPEKGLWAISPGGVSPGLISGVNPQTDFDNVRIGNAILFAGYTPNYGIELWRTDGTLSGTTLVKDLLGGSYSGNPTSFAVMDNVAYFLSDTATLMRSDGTASGTFPIFYFSSLGESSWLAMIPGLYAYNGHVYFFYNNPVTYSLTLWRTDGTMAGTTMVSSSLTSVPGYGQFLGLLGGRLMFFSSMGGAYGLWSTDGTAAGTLPLAVGSLNEDLKFEHLVTSPSRMYFACTANFDGVDGYELCRTDGTIDGTRFVANLEDNGSSTSSFPRSFTLIDDELFFTAFTSGMGRELWRTKGLQANTRLALDLNPGPVGSDPKELTAMGTNLIFRADDGLHGRELWGFSTIGDECPDDSQKDSPGLCGCGAPDIDSDGDTILDCNDACPLDSLKATSAGLCGCGISDDDLNQNDLADCFDPAITGIPGRPNVKVKKRTVSASVAQIEGVRYEFILSPKKKSQGKSKKQISLNGKAVFKNVLRGSWRVRYRLILGTVNVQSSPFSPWTNISVKATR